MFPKATPTPALNPAAPQAMPLRGTAPPQAAAPNLFNFNPAAAPSPFRPAVQANAANVAGFCFPPATHPNIFQQSPGVAPAALSNPFAHPAPVTNPPAWPNLFAPQAPVVTTAAMPNPFAAPATAMAAPAPPNPFVNPFQVTNTPAWPNMFAPQPPVTTTAAAPNPFAIPAPVMAFPVAPKPVQATTAPAWPNMFAAQPPVATTAAAPNPFAFPAPVVAFPVAPKPAPATTAPAWPNLFAPQPPVTTTVAMPNPFAIPAPVVAFPVAPKPAPATTAPAWPHMFAAQPPVTTTAAAPNPFSVPAPVASFPVAPNPVQATTAPAWPNLFAAPVSVATSAAQAQQQSNPAVQQNFLTACLIDPYGNQGKKDGTTLGQTPVSKELTGSSISSVTPTMVPIPPSIPVVLPIQSNSRKTLSSHALRDVRLNLKPVSASFPGSETMKSSDQLTKVPTEAAQRPLRSAFTQEEETVLLSQKKTSKLRLSNDILVASVQAEPVRSLYPSRRLDELEALNRMIDTTTISTTKENTTKPAIPAPAPVSIPRESRSHSTSPAKVPANTAFRQSSSNDTRSVRLPTLTRDDYYTKPTMSELRSLFNDKGECHVKQFTVGRENFGSVTFYGRVNLAGLNLDEIVQIQRHEVIVYPDDGNKPAVGEELNLPARITLLDVYPTDRATQEEITDLQRIRAMNYDDHLRQVTQKFDGEFISYIPEDGSWTFMVKHFTRYGLDDSNDVYSSAPLN